MSKDTDKSNVDDGSKRTSLVSNKLVEEASKRKKTVDSSCADDPFLLVSSFLHNLIHYQILLLIFSIYEHLRCLEFDFLGVG